MSEAPPSSTLTIRTALRKRNVFFWVGVVFLAVVAFCALLPAQVAPMSPLSQHIQRARLMRPDAAHPFGTDALGRDILSRVIYGARMSLLIGLSVASASSVAGGMVGLTAGWFRSMDNLLMRIVDGLLAFPGIILAIALVAALGAGIWQEVVALSAAFFPLTARIMRSVTLQLREADFIQAARAVGASTWRILLQHVLRNGFGSLVVRATYVLAVSIVSDAGLGFLGLGVPPPAPTWGSMLGDAQSYIQPAWWWVTFPGLTLMCTAVSINIVGDVVRDVLDPRLR